MMKRYGAFAFLALLAPAMVVAQVQTAPLPPPEQPPTQPDRSERQTGMAPSR